ncbi:hypothetical protein ACFQRB_08285 [Halobaculum litoreum]|uniref:Haloacid dehalogenase-like hydrolase n=1 Tax=Halobaculum litoreum TaxID=3031998 RepID=A0ABD5XS94_9EURY
MAVLFDLDDTLCVDDQNPAALLAATFDRVGVDPFCDASTLASTGTELGTPTATSSSTASSSASPPSGPPGATRTRPLPTTPSRITRSTRWRRSPT